MISKNTICIYGFHSVQKMLLLKPERVLDVYLTVEKSDKRSEEILNLASFSKIGVNRITKKKMSDWCQGDEHQGVAARIIPNQPLSGSEFIKNLDQFSKPPLVLALEDIQDPHNLGACFRTAEAASVQAVILPKDRSVGLTGVVHKTASGALEFVSIVFVPNLSRMLADLKEKGLWIFGAAGEGPSSLYEMDFSFPSVLVLGNEGKGLRELTKKQCDYLMHIPMFGCIESLNVSVATGICLYEAVRQRL